MFGHRIPVAFRTTDAYYSLRFRKWHIDQFHSTSQSSDPFQIARFFKQGLIDSKPRSDYQPFSLADQQLEVIIIYRGVIKYLIVLLLKIFLEVWMDFRRNNHFALVCFGRHIAYFILKVKSANC